MPTSRQVLLLGARSDADLVRATLQAGYEYVSCEPDQAAFARDTDAHFDFVVSSGLPVQSQIEADAAARWPLIILVEADEPAAVARMESGALLVVRGPAFGLQLVQAARICAATVAKENFIRAVEGPLVHDLRGIVGLVDLSARLLETAGQAGNLSSSREQLLNACRRISWWLGDLGAHLVLRLDPDRRWPRVQGIKWAEVISSKVADLSVDHPRRSLSVTLASRPTCTLSPEHVLLVLQGILEVALKTTSSMENIHFTLAGDASEELSLTVRAERSSPSPTLRAILENPTCWPPGPGSDVPFHFVSALLLARSMGGDITVDWLDQQVLAVARWPASPALA
jgi:hypothetical protein